MQSFGNCRFTLPPILCARRKGNFHLRQPGPVARVWVHYCHCSARLHCRNRSLRRPTLPVRQPLRNRTADDFEVTWPSLGCRSPRSPRCYRLLLPEILSEKCLPLCMYTVTSFIMVVHSCAQEMLRYATLTEVGCKSKAHVINGKICNFECCLLEKCFQP